MKNTLESSDISFAIEALAGALRADNYTQACLKAGEAIHFILDYLAVNNPHVKSLTEKEAEFAKILHTYMRKCGDDPTSNILYTLIDNHRGLDVWYGFICGCTKVIYSSQLLGSIKNLKPYTIYFGGMDNVKCTMVPDNILMYNALKMWGDDFVGFVWYNIKQDFYET